MAPPPRVGADTSGTGCTVRPWLPVASEGAAAAERDGVGGSVIVDGTLVVRLLREKDGGSGGMTSGGRVDDPKSAVVGAE
jgi:hypothetical protein